MSGPVRHELLAVLDFGSQYGQLIARRARELGVYAEILPPDTDVETLRRRGARAVILSGGPDSAHAQGARTVDLALYDSGLPVLGICYGAQRMAADLGGVSGPGEEGEFGPAVLTPAPGARDLGIGDGNLLIDLEPGATVWMSHSDRVEALPPGFVPLASTRGAPLAAFADPVRRLYGVQFHPEVGHTQGGRAVMARFLHDVAGFAGDWTMAAFAQEAVAAIRAQVGERGRAIAALSGGVDSSVAAALAARALGDRLTAIFVDHGLLRLGEADEVMAAMGALGVRVRRVDAAERFLAALEGVGDPERKRRIIGTLFVRVFEEEARRVAEEGAGFLVQGTLYPDVVESGAGRSQTIKTHHNVGGLPEDLGLELVEPLRLLFKDEVRALGRELGLPEAIVSRQPFPGPGLAVRIAGPVTAQGLEILRQADRVVREEIEAAGLAPSLFQYFAVLLAPVRAVGVMGDNRTYGMPVVVRAVASEDGMTADRARLPDDVLGRIATRLTNEVAGVGRVLYDLTTKPPGTIEWE
ncbi:MAG: glutamine-hydrolyzing GMP synthase [Firmicutes bacterium]|nr:glutamine-hydrolyzing GMP synthase [Bacillota bacterium]